MSEVLEDKEINKFDDLEIRIVNINTIYTQKRNARIHDDRNIESIEHSLRKYGQVKPLVVNKKNGEIVGGNGTKEAMLNLGWTQCKITEVDLDTISAKELALILNRTSDLSRFDDTILGEDLEILKSENIDLNELGWTDEEFKLLQCKLERDGDRISGESNNQENQESEPEPDPETAKEKALKLLEKWGVEENQVWLIQSKSQPGYYHKLICGDCRDPKVTLALCDQKINGIFTSPPYAEQRKENYPGVPVDQYVKWWFEVQKNIKDILAEDGSLFINIKPHTEEKERVLYVFDLILAMKRKWGWKYIEEFCWLNHSSPVGDLKNRKRFKNGFEPIYQFALNTELKFNPDEVKHYSENAKNSSKRKDINGSGFDCGHMKGEGLAYPSNVIDINKSSDSYHSAAFPIKLPEFFIKAYSDPGDTWLDPFSGSGTVLVSCESNSRLGYGVDILPENIAVSLERLSFLGLNPEKE